jgi:hypothetical protein
VRKLFKYAFVLVVGAAIGAWIVLSLEDPDVWPEATAANFERAPPATLTIAPAENEHDLPRRPGPLAPYAQSGTAKVERLHLAEKATDFNLLIESLALDDSTPRSPLPPPRPLDASRANALLGQACASERAALDRLRQEPSAKAGGLFWRDMQCEGLRPQVRLLLESLNVTPDQVGSAATLTDTKARGAF